LPEKPFSEAQGGGRVIVDLTATPARLYAVYPAAVKGRLAAPRPSRPVAPIDLRYDAVTLAGQPMAAVVPGDSVAARTGQARSAATI